MTGRLTEREIDALARHLPVLRVIAGEWSAGPAVIDSRAQRLDHLTEWRGRISARHPMTKDLVRHIDYEIARLSKPLPPPPQRRVKKIDERARIALDLYIDEDLTLEQIGERFDITRERVRQLIDAYDPTIYALAQRRRHARIRLRRFVEYGISDASRCVICGVIFTRDEENRRTMVCSAEHRKVWENFRYHTNPRSHTVMRSAHARRILETGVGSIANATNVLNGQPTKRRWMQESSSTFEWALKAYRLGWPLFDNLPPEIQEQIRDYATYGPRSRKNVTPRSAAPRNVMRRRLLAGEELSGTVAARELGTVSSVFTNLKKDMIAEGYHFLTRNEGRLVFARLVPSDLEAASGCQSGFQVVPDQGI